MTTIQRTDKLGRRINPRSAAAHQRNKLLGMLGLAYHSLETIIDQLQNEIRIQRGKPGLDEAVAANLSIQLQMLSVEKTKQFAAFNSLRMDIVQHYRKWHDIQPP